MFRQNWLRSLSRHLRSQPTRRLSRLRLDDLEDRTVPADLGFALGVGGEGTQEARASAMDSSGNVYVTGSFEGAVDFDPGVGITSLTSTGGTDIFVASYSPTGAFRWVQQMGGTGNDAGNGITISSSSSVVTTGFFEGAATFRSGDPAQTLTSLGGKDAFVNLLLTSGTSQTVKQIGGPGDDIGYGVAAPSSSTLYVTGTFQNTASFNVGTPADDHTSLGQSDAFVSRFSNNRGRSLDFSWARQFGGAGDDVGRAVASDSSGNVYTTGSFEGTGVDLDPGAGVNTLDSSGGADIFISKLNSSGDGIWAKKIGGSADDAGQAIALDSSGNVYTTGSFSGSGVDFDPDPAATAPLTGIGRDIFVSSLDTIGAYRWAKKIGGSGNDSGNAIAVAAGGVYTTGSFQSSPADFDPGSGAANLSVMGGEDAFVSRLDLLGNYIWAGAFGGTGDDSGAGISVNAAGNAYVSGSFEGEADFQPGSGSFSLSATGRDLFLAQLYPTEINGHAWRDLDIDGIMDADEPKLANIRIELFDTADGVIGNGNDVSLGSRITATDGSYKFIEPVGSVGYYVQASQALTGTSGYSPPNLAFNHIGTDNDVDISGRSAIFTTSPAAPAKTVDAGLLQGAPPFAAWGFGGSAVSNARSVTTDAAGNTYVAGSYSGSLDVNPGEETNGIPGRRGIGTSEVEGFIVKYSPAGAYIWSASLGGDGFDEATEVVVDTDGSVYVTGLFSGTLEYSNPRQKVVLPDGGGTDGFVIKLTSAGSLVWARQLGGANNDSVAGLAPDGQGGLYVTGAFTGSAAFGGVTFPNDVGTDAFVVKMDAAGNVSQPLQLAGDGTITPAGIAVGASGVYLTGSFTGTVDFDPDPVKSASRTSVGSDAFLLKLSAGGVFGWKKVIGGNAEDTARGIALDAGGNIHIAGTFQDTVDFNPETSNPANRNSAGTDAYVAKYDARGGLAWVRQLGGAGEDSAAGVAVDARGYVYVGGTFQGAADFDPGTGLTETFRLTSQGSDAFMTKLDREGKFVLARQLGGAGADSATAIAVYGEGTVCTVGSYQGTADFDPAGASVYSLTSIGTTPDVFVSKIQEVNVRGQVWNDLDGDGVRDAGEPALTNASVTLYDAVDDSALGTVRTTDGTYQFPNPKDSSGYYIRIEVPKGGTSGNSLPALEPSRPAQGGNPFFDSDVDATGMSAVAKPFFGAVATLDAGFKELALQLGGWGIGGAGTDAGKAVARDEAGNIYVAGTYQNTVDFDPRPGLTERTTPAGKTDGFVAKYTPAGVLSWVHPISLAAAGITRGNVDVAGVAVDKSGNVHVAGSFTGTVAFDPGIRPMASLGGSDVFVLKLTTDGSFVWARRLGGASADQARGIAVDDAGEVYTAGTFKGTGDFDPGTGVRRLTSAGLEDIFISKLKADGTQVWTQQQGGAGADVAYGIAVDKASGNVFTTGFAGKHADFNPGRGVFDLTGNTEAGFVSKLRSDGTWGNGTSLDSWAKTIGAARGYGIAVGKDGNVSATGYYDIAGVDFDPGLAAVQTLPHSGNQADAFLLNLTQSGDFGWVRQLPESGGNDFGQAVVTDDRLNVYVTGRTGPDGGDVFLEKYDPSGLLLKNQSIHSGLPLTGAPVPGGNSVSVDSNGTLFVTGAFQGTADLDSGGGILNVTSAGLSDAFVWKVSQGGISGRVWNDLDGDGVREPSELDLEGAVVELFSTVDGVAGNGDDVRVGIQASAADGGYRFQGAVAGQMYYIRVSPPVAGGLAFTNPNQGGEDTDSDVNASGLTDVFVADEALPSVLDAGLQGVIPPFGFVWAGSAVLAGNPPASEATANWVDAAGNTYVTGRFKGTADVDAGSGVTSLASTPGTGGAADNFDTFVAKYTVGGALLWAKQFGGPGDERGNGITTDSQGNVYVTGYFQGASSFAPDAGGSHTLTAASLDVFVAKLDPAGNFVWAGQIGAEPNDPNRDQRSNYGLDIAAGSDRVVISGSFQGTADFDPGAGKKLLASFGAQDAFVTSWTTDGAFNWAVRTGGENGDDAAEGVALDPNGLVLAAGSFSGTADFNPGQGVLDLHSAGALDAFAWKLDKDGNVVWADNGGGDGTDQAHGIALDANGGAYVTGSFTGSADFDRRPSAISGKIAVNSSGASDAFVWRIDQNGAPLWVRGIGGPDDDTGNDVTSNPTGVYVAGSFTGTADFDPGAGRLPLTADAGTDAFVVKLDPAGERQWARRFGGSLNDVGNGIGIDAAGQVTFAGGLAGSVTFDPGDGTQTIPGVLRSNFYAARVNQTPSGGGFPLDAFEQNNTFASAADLGVIGNRERTISNLSLSSVLDEDWFRFDLLSPGGAENFVRINLGAGSGDVDLQLLRDPDPLAHLLDPVLQTTSTAGDDTADFEEISLAGLAAGSYYVRVFGAANPAYKLSFDVPPAFARDVNDSGGRSNDTPAQATELGTLRTTTRLDSLSIDTADNDDWYAFTTDADGTRSSQALINNFRNSQGDLDLELYASDGTTLLRSSAGVDDSETVGLDGLPKGRYYLRVFGRDHAINGNYSLTVNPPPPLVVDQGDQPARNDSSATATNLGELHGTTIREKLSIDSTTDEDWFRFTITTQGSAGHLAAIDFVNTDGDLELRLYNDHDAEPVAASTGSGDTEQVSLRGLAAGTYLLKVSGYSRATQPAYRLRIIAPASPAALPADFLDGGAGNQTPTTASIIQSPGQATLAGTKSLTSLNLATAADEDWFRFTTAGRGAARHGITLSYPAATGPFGLELYNSAGKKKIVTATGSNGNLVVSLKGLAADTYLARVFVPKGGQTGGTYELNFDTPASALTVAPDDWTVMVYMTADTLAEQAFNDINEMETAVAGLPGSVNIAVMWDQSAALRKTYPTGNGSQAAWGTTGFAVIAPDTNPDQVATKFEIMAEQDSGDPATLKKFTDWAKQNAPASHYTLVFWDHGAGLGGFNFDTQDGRTSNHLTTAKVLEALGAKNQPLPDAAKFDLIAFDACFMGVLETEYNLGSVARTVVASQDAIPGGGFAYDQALSRLKTDPANVDGEELAGSLVASFGNRYRPSGSKDTLSAVRTAGLTSLADALRLFTTTVHGATGDEQLRVATIAVETLPSNSSAAEQRDLGAFLSGVSETQGLSQEIRDAADSALAALRAAVINKTSDLRDSSGLSVYLPVVDLGHPDIDPALVKNYATEFAGFATATGWLGLLTDLRTALGIDRLGTADGDDKIARNNDLPSATILKPLGAVPISKSTLSLDSVNGVDEDYYVFPVSAPAGSSLEVDVTVGSTGGSLTAEFLDRDNHLLLDAFGSPVRLTTSSTGRLRLDNLPAGVQSNGEEKYYLRFYSGDGLEVRNYGFTINPPVPNADPTGKNVSPEKTFPLPEKADKTNVYSGFLVEGDSKDWVRLPGTKLAKAELRQVTVTLDGSGPVTVQLRDESGAVVSAATGETTLVLPYTQHTNGESHVLVITNANAANVRYGLKLETAPPSATDYPLDRFDRNQALADNAAWTDLTRSIKATGGGQAVVMTGSGQALWSNLIAADVAVQTAFSLPNNGKPSSVSVLARANLIGSKLTAYEAQLAIDSKGVLTAKLYRIVNSGNSAPLISVKLTSTDLTGILRLEVTGQFLRILVNGAQVLECADDQMLSAGRVGIKGLAGAGFDDFQASAISPALPMTFDASPGGLGKAWQAVSLPRQTGLGSFTYADGRFVNSSAGVPAAAVYTAARLADVAVSANYSLTAAGQYVGLIARDTGGSSRSYYETRVTRTTKTGAADQFILTLTRYVGGTPRLLITGMAVAGPAGSLKLSVRGAEINVFVNDTKVGSVIDNSIPKPGSAGIVASAGMALANLEITAIPPFADNFNRTDSSLISSDWVKKAGDVQLASRHLLGTGSQDGIAVATKPAPQANVSISAAVDLTSPGARMVGLIARYVDPGTYYEARLSGTGDGTFTVSIIRVVNGAETTLKTVSRIKLTAGTLRFDVTGTDPKQGADLKISLFGELLSFKDKTPLTAAGLAGVHLGVGDTMDDFVVR